MEKAQEKTRDSRLASDELQPNETMKKKLVVISQQDE